MTQPHATLAMFGLKTIETRSRRLSYRGPLLIHAAAGLGPVGGICGFTELLGQTAFTRALEPHYGYDYTLPASVARLRTPFGAIVGQVNQIDCVATWRTGQRPSRGLPPRAGNKLGRCRRRSAAPSARSATSAHLYADAGRWPRRSQRAVSSACGGGLGAAGMNQDLTTQRQLLDRLVLDRLLTVARYLAARRPSPMCPARRPVCANHADRQALVMAPITSPAVRPVRARGSR